MNNGFDTNKFQVCRTDGSSGPQGKHQFCKYFVLDLVHDPYAHAALEQYAFSCEDTHPELALDIRRMILGKSVS